LVTGGGALLKLVDCGWLPAFTGTDFLVFVMLSGKRYEAKMYFVNGRQCLW
jgi:hypothetical protein